MTVKVTFIHTVASVAGMFSGLSRKYIPDAKITHVADESLIQRALAAEGLTPAITRRVCETICQAEDAGADIIQVTCSSITPAVILSRNLVSVPVLTIDEPVVRSLVKKHKKIGVIATAISTLKPSAELVQSTAGDMKRKVQTNKAYCTGAYDALFAGDLETHDRIVLSRLKALAKKSDAVLLAQASMARVADMLPKDLRKKTPVLSSPVPAMKYLKSRVNRLAEKG
jgi:Asp/Glu/hydantoin racemase